jgi:hypothetical protein
MIARASAGAPTVVLAAPDGEAAGHEASVPEDLPACDRGAVAAPACAGSPGAACAARIPRGTAIATITATALTTRPADPIRLLQEPPMMTTQSRTDPQRP